MKNAVSWLPSLALTAGVFCSAALAAGPAGRTAAPGSPAGSVGSAGPGMAVGGGVRSSSNGVTGNPAPIVTGPGAMVSDGVVTAPTVGTTPNQAALQGTAVTEQQVLDAQRALAASGYSVTLDGVAGPQTQSAIRSFQTAHGLPATGLLDSDTVNLMNNGNSGVTNQNRATESPSNL